MFQRAAVWDETWCPVGDFLLYLELPLYAAWNNMPAVFPSLVTTRSFTFIAFFLGSGHPKFWSRSSGIITD